MNSQNTPPARLIIVALGLSRPGTMGGNSKITVEIARNLAASREVHFIVPEGKLATLTANVTDLGRLHIHTIPDFPGNDKLHPLAFHRQTLPILHRLFTELAVKASDFVFSCSDFHVDVTPIYPLQSEFGFRWIPSLFLFVPFVTENLVQGYRFPAVKYLVYWLYQRALFALMKRRASAFVVTNKSDFRHFPRRFNGRLFDFYGGVNVDQIPTEPQPKTRDVVFCSRLHPQKGIDAFLDTWALVHANEPALRLTVIGNGEPAYERYLKDKAKRLGLADSIDWLGYVNNEAKFKIYAASRLFVHPTVFDNNGMVAAEALCTGLPVVMQDLPALRDVYTTGCLKVPFGDRQAFAEAIVRLLTDKAAYTAVAPTPDQVAELRARWNWATRVADFDAWLKSLPTEAADKAAP